MRYILILILRVIIVENYCIIKKNQENDKNNYMIDKKGSNLELERGVFKSRNPISFQVTTIILEHSKKVLK